MSDESFERLSQLVQNPPPIRTGMFELIDLCAKAEPSPIWDRFRDMDFEGDQKEMTSWLIELLENEPPPVSINGFWFGLFNPILDDERPTCCLYLAGSERFDPGQCDPDWPCRPEYFPENRYSSSEILHRLYRESEDADDYDGIEAELTLCHGYSCLLVAHWCRGPMRKLLLGNASFRGVAVGFDSGDEILIDILREN